MRATSSERSRGFFTFGSPPFGAPPSLAPFGAPCGCFGFLPSDCCWVSAIDLNSGTLGDAHLLASTTFADELEADAGRLAVLGVGDRKIGQVDRPLFGDDPAFLLCGLALMALDHVDAAHKRAVFIGAHSDHFAGATFEVIAVRPDEVIAVRPDENRDHFAGATFVTAGEHDDLVALADLGCHQSTSGASE